MKKIISIITAFIIFLSTIAYAGILGTLQSSNVTDISNFSVKYYNNIYESTQENVGLQTEYYYEYTPSQKALPIVVNGSQIYGRRTLTQAANYMKSKNQVPLMGINADYFSFKTGIPMGHTIIDGKIVTKDASGMNAIGFRNDGTAFISWLQINTIAHTSQGDIIIDNVNKWCQPNMTGIYMMSDFFGNDTKTSSECLFVILSPTSGELRLGTDDFTLCVDEKFTYSSAIAIPKGKYVIAINTATGTADQLSALSKLQIGDEITIESTSVFEPEKWSNATQAIGSIGGRLIENGVVKTNFEKGANPRTAVGIKRDGTVVFYVIDGRVKDHSYGVQLSTLAQRMNEIGCIDALNLDGGGSSTIGGIFDGTNFELLNIPSDGSMRACANFIFLDVNHEFIDIGIDETEFCDISGHWAEKDILSLQNVGIIKGSYYNHKLYFKPDDNLTRAQFAVILCAYLHLNTDKYSNISYSDQSAFDDWMIGPISAISEKGIMSGRTDGSFSPNDNITRAEVCTCISRAIEGIEYSNVCTFSDLNQIPSWALGGISYLYKNGIISGYTDNTFRPQNGITRAEAGVLINRLITK